MTHYGTNNITISYEVQSFQTIIDCLSRDYKDKECWIKIPYNSVTFKYPYDYIVDNDVVEDSKTPTCTPDDPKPFKMFSNCVPSKETYQSRGRDIEMVISSSIISQIIL